jgi:dTMP kinase
MKKNLFPGKLVVIEGLDGSGKSTQIKLLGQKLAKKRVDYYLTREHTRDGPAGKLIERIVSSQEKLNPIALQLLFVVDRLDHLEREIKPELTKGKLVVCDRYYWTTVAYGSQVADKEWFIEANRYCLEPDLVIYLEVSPQEAIRRTKTRGEKATIFEEISKINKFSQSYQWLLSRFSDQSVKINGERQPEIITEDIVKILRARGLIL